jgi:hypothetical protein
MTPSALSLLNDPAVRAALRQAWTDSVPGLSGGHEEGGFVLRDDSGIIHVGRWPAGETDGIMPPPHASCRVGSAEIVATFHTHPNTGSDYLQEPSDTDRRAVRDDPDLKGANYVDEIVVAARRVYLILPDGTVNDVGETAVVLADL